MSAAAGKGLEGDMQGAFEGEAPPSAGIFTQPVKVWDATNTMFVHYVAGEDIKEFPMLHHKDPQRVPIPADAEPDLVNFFYGEMAQALTARPQFSDGCCCPPREFHIARHMFGDAVAYARVDMPAMGCMYTGGCSAADVSVTPADGVGGVSYKGTLKKNACAECFGNETTLQWETPNKPWMTYRAVSTLDTCKYNCCKDVWIGWRGSSGAVPQTVILYDSSIVYNLCQQWELGCIMCKVCKASCCDRADMAPRFARSDDLRRVILTRYDYEFAIRKPAEGEDHQVGHGEAEKDAAAVRLLPRAHNVDALYTSRLYHDVVCGKPNVCWANASDAKHERESAIDVRYRGSRRHKVVTEDDHLIVLAGLIMQGLWMFPATNGQRAGGVAGGGPAWLNRGMIVPRDGIADMTGTRVSNAV